MIPGMHQATIWPNMSANTFSCIIYVQIPYSQTFKLGMLSGRKPLNYVIYLKNAEFPKSKLFSLKQNKNCLPFK